MIAGTLMSIDSIVDSPKISFLILMSIRKHKLN